jgi:hypothetical protein
MPKANGHGPTQPGQGGPPALEVGGSGAENQALGPGRASLLSS